MDLIFDLDGTLIDSRKGIASALKHACYEIDGVARNVPISIIGPPIGEMIATLAREFTSEDISEAERIFRSEYDSLLWKDYTVYDGVLENLIFFKNLGIQLHIATNKPMLPTEKICSDAGLIEVMTSIRCLDPLLMKKKSEMLVEFDGCGGEVLLIGDTGSDAQAAAELGIDFVFCEYGYGVNNSNYTSIHDFIELREKIQ